MSQPASETTLRSFPTSSGGNGEPLLPGHKAPRLTGLPFSSYICCFTVVVTMKLSPPVRDCHMSRSCSLLGFISSSITTIPSVSSEMERWAAVDIKSCRLTSLPRMSSIVRCRSLLPDPGGPYVMMLCIGAVSFSLRNPAPHAKDVTSCRAQRPGSPSSGTGTRRARCTAASPSAAASPCNRWPAMR